ncbi:hypothetical protein LWI28_006089 [Acer negundo]|uniref:Uncharacterized protein n=1 Tax=Acer negundo TaxID=4023 RepID=A0AAD5ID90_ACENE|nr:hypothetical protein LWI28_006089 [Acer negundo]
MGNLLEIEKKYEVKRAGFLKMKKEKSEVDERLQIALGTIKSQKVDFSKAFALYWKISEEFFKDQTNKFDCVVEEVKTIRRCAYLDFDFSTFDSELKKAMNACGKAFPDQWRIFGLSPRRLCFQMMNQWLCLLMIRVSVLLHPSLKSLTDPLVAEKTRILRNFIRV